MARALVHSLYGESAMRHARPDHMNAECSPAPPGGADFVGRGKCKASNDTCEAFPVKETDYCVGHTRMLNKALADEQG